jgi:hypothetical protein
MKTAVEFYREQNIELLEELRLGLITHLHWYQKQAIIFEQAKEMEKEQRQEDTNYGYSQGWDDGNENKEPMRPELKKQEQ